ncbi:MAG TPA: tetratricopeptide repeat protein [Saprospiraceae bacterium]|nr:tetratricopeptide repeat protein [Saprospiraceae bacterium]HMQ83252.1 tetratricopeptide repeat protein [Saprospiraceae bacterium]
MRHQILFSLLLLGSLLLSCQQNTSTKDKQVDESTSIPELLDRNEALYHGKEWDNVQNQYAQFRDKILANADAGEARLFMAQLFMNEARITGEHGHYYPAALELLNKAIEADTENNDLLFRALSSKAAVLLSQHDFSQALEVGQKAVAMNPYNAFIYGVLVDAHVELGQYEKAVEMADKMMSIRPDLRSYARVSYLREIHGDVDGAIEALEMAVKAGYPGYEQTSWTRLTLGELYQRYDRVEQAEQAFQMALQERPDYPFAYAALAELKIEQKAYEAAEKLLKQAAAIIPEVGFYEQMAHIYKVKGNQIDFEKTIAIIFSMLQDDVDSGHNMNLEYATIYSELLQDYDKALEYALAEWEKRPENIDVNRQLAGIYFVQNNLEKAQNHFEKAQKTNSKHPDLLVLQGQLAMN